MSFKILPFSIGSFLLLGLASSGVAAVYDATDASSQSSQDLGQATTIQGGIGNLVGPASAAYEVECYDESEVSFLDVELNHPYEIDGLRCTRATYGDFRFEAMDDDFDQVDLLVLPWIEHVGGDLRVERFTNNSDTFDTVKLSRLRHVGGEIDLDFNPMFEGMRLPSLTSVGSLDVDMRQMDLDLTGLDALQEISGSLRFVNDHPADPPVFRGMHGLVEVGSLSISGRGALFDSSGPGLSQLALVRGNVSISITAPSIVPNGYRAIYATQAIQTICGNLTISGDTANLNLATDFPSLDRVVGTATLNGNDISNQIPGLSIGGNPAECQ